VDDWNDSSDGVGGVGFDADGVDELIMDPDEGGGYLFGDQDGSAGDGVNFIDGPGGKLKWLKNYQLPGEEIDSDPDADGDPSTNRQVAQFLYFVKTPSGSPEIDGTVYKLNADPVDLDGQPSGTDNATYGKAVWSVASNAGKKYSFKGSLQFSNWTKNLFVAMSSDDDSEILAKLSMEGLTAPPVSSSWTSSSGVNNDKGASLSYAADSWHLFVAPVDGTKMIATRETAGTGESRYVTADLGDGTGTFTTFPMHYTRSEYVLVGCGNRLEKVKDDFDPTIPAPAPNGDRVTGEASGIFPVTLQGKVVYWVLRLGNRLFWATDEGYVYRATWRENLADAGPESIDAGFPKKIPGRVTSFWYWPIGTTEKAMYVGTDEGAIIRIPLE
jgi:hypothetical protein